MYFTHHAGFLVITQPLKKILFRVRQCAQKRSPNGEPARVVERRRRRQHPRAGEKERSIDPFHPRVGPFLLRNVEGDRGQSSKQEKPHARTIWGMRAENAVRSDCLIMSVACAKNQYPPNDRRPEENVKTWTCITAFVIRIAKSSNRVNKPTYHASGKQKTLSRDTQCSKV